ncbi:MAG TPA: TetR/AcrR family transcriptional regulator [Gammaproteobacteria bacterium]|nr:TetR/AcrR family transcriptional regulator [Gammaproteobacteria bacterium]
MSTSHAATRPDTRTRLLQAAASLMWERSFQATGVDDLCERAEAKKGSFYHFFPSKVDLAIAAIEGSWQQVQEAVFEPVFSSDAGGLEQLRTLSEKVYEFQRRAAADTGAILGCPFGNLGQEMATQDARIRESLARIFAGHCAYIEQALARAEAAGEIPAGDNRLRARNIYALMQGVQLLAKVNNDAEILRSITPALMAIAGH